MRQIAIIVSGLLAAVVAMHIDAAPTYTATPIGVVGSSGRNCTVYVETVG